MDQVLELAAGQHSLIGRGQALAFGMTVGQVGQRVRAGRWEIVGRGVYRVAGSVPTWEQRVLTAVLATGAGAAASRRTAAACGGCPASGARRSR